MRREAHYKMIGKKVRLLRTLRTKGGGFFRSGRLMLIKSFWRGFALEPLWLRNGQARYISRVPVRDFEIYRQKKNHRPRASYWRNRREDFFRKIKMTDGCWIWLGTIYSEGYGAFCYRGYKTGAHRWSWIFHNGPIPRGLYVLHHCDNRQCVRPSHLFLGTQKDNIRDCARKGRLFITRGEQYNQAKLRASDILEIRRLCQSRSYSQSKIAREFGVNQSLISRILSGEKWKHVPAN